MWRSGKKAKSQGGQSPFSAKMLAKVSMLVTVRGNNFKFGVEYVFIIPMWKVLKQFVKYVVLLFRCDKFI